MPRADYAQLGPADGSGCYACAMATPADPLICQCVAVYRSEIQEAIAAGADTVDEVGDACDAGTGCHSCHGDIKALLEAHARKQLARQEAPTPLRQLSLFDQLAGSKPSGPGGAHGR